MNTLELVSLGTLIVTVVAVVLLLLVQRELGPNGKLGGKGKWLLFAGLGSGVLAFGVKMGLIVVMVGMPDRFIGAHAAHAPKPLRHASISRPARTAAPERYTWEALPPTPPVPPENPQSPAKIALGQKLFFDKNLSRTREVSCASCHHIETGAGDDGQAVSTGIEQLRGERNAPTVWNAAFQRVLFWDGRAGSLEAQAKGPLVNPLEMGMPSLREVERRVAENPDYRARFDQAFGRAAPITIDRVAQAIAAYERTLITPDTPYDRFVRGDANALNPAQLRGMALFESVGCVRCHRGPNFSAASVFESGSPLRLFPSRVTAEVEQYGLDQDSGLATSGEIPGVWRVPSLRNVALTAPYFHNGAVTDLAEAVRIMASVQLGRPTGRNGEVGESRVAWSPEERTLNQWESRPLADQQVTDIVAFLHALSSDRLVARMRVASGG